MASKQKASNGACPSNGRQPAPAPQEPASERRLNLRDSHPRRLANLTPAGVPILPPSRFANPSPDPVRAELKSIRLDLDERRLISSALYRCFRYSSFPANLFTGRGLSVIGEYVLHAHPGCWHCPRFLPR
jgi:hypothetical protein